MKSDILILTDLHWHLASKRISQNDLALLQETNLLGYGERFLSIRNYWNIICHEKPDLVLLGGDLTGDGSCGHGFHMAFYYLLCLLNDAKIQTYFIQGDNDVDKYYSFILENLEHLEWAHEISNKSVIHNELRILGIPFVTTNDKRKLKRLIAEKADRYDIILCHSALKRRTHLFNFETELIVTGHFDNKLCHIKDSIYLSLSNDNSVINYAMIDWQGDEKVVTYNFIHPQRNRRISYSESYQDLRSSRKEGTVFSDMVPIRIEEFEKLILPNSEYEKDKNAIALAIKFLRGHNYKVAIEFLFSNRETDSLDIKELNYLRKQFFTSKHKLSKSMLIDFLGSKVRSQLG